MSPVDDAGFATLARRISARSGLALDAYKDKCLRRRIAVRMRACGVSTYHDYLDVLEERPDELDRLVDVLTINVTKFYRNPETWRQLTRSVIPELLKGKGPLRVWSAGCASGEESYTLAMVFADEAERQGHPEWLERVTIDATDIDRESLDRARAARYPEAAFSDAPESLVSRFTLPAEDGSRTIVDRVRQRVRVSRHDLTTITPPAPPYHLILCRNVIIYFDRPTQERLLLGFHDSLVVPGYLVLGKVETIFGPARGKLELVEPRERIYRRNA